MNHLTLIGQEFGKGNRYPRCYVSDTHENPLDDPNVQNVKIDDVFNGCWGDKCVVDVYGKAWDYAVLAPQWENTSKLPTCNCNVEFTTAKGNSSTQWVGTFDVQNQVFKTTVFDFPRDEYGNIVGRERKNRPLQFSPEQVIEWLLIEF